MRWNEYLFPRRHSTLECQGRVYRVLAWKSYVVSQCKLYSFCSRPVHIYMIACSVAPDDIVHNTRVNVRHRHRHRPNYLLAISDCGECPQAWRSSPMMLDRLEWAAKRHGFFAHNFARHRLDPWLGIYNNESWRPVLRQLKRGHLTGPLIAISSDQELKIWSRCGWCRHTLRKSIGTVDEDYDDDLFNDWVWRLSLLVSNGSTLWDLGINIVYLIDFW